MMIKRIAMIGILAWAMPVMAAPSPTTEAGLVQRILGERAQGIEVQKIPEDQGRDVYEIESVGGKVVLRGNNGVSVASALNAYLRDFCNAHVSWNCGDQLKLPQILPSVPKKVRVVSPYSSRFTYNYCTHGYTMAWWGWERWERELDFLAMQGVNMALILQGQEQVWIDALKSIGYSDLEVRTWLCMPSHQPWQYMSNMENHGGVVPKSLVAKRIELGRKIVSRMRDLGIDPVLQGYYGIVPSDFGKRFPDATVHAQGTWHSSGLKRPDMLDPTDPLFKNLASAFYESQKKHYGASGFYAADPFHEGGRTKGIDLPACGNIIYDAMQKASPGSTWVMQSWQGNPKQKMIDALPKDHLLVLDLYCEDGDNWKRRKEFGNTPWLWCTIHNFGGNTGMTGKLRRLADGPPAAFKEAKHMKGIGGLMEGSETTPMLWDMFFQNSWRTEAPDLDTWLKAYTKRRYGADSPKALKSMQIVSRTLYDVKSGGQLPLNTAICAAPSLDPKQRARAYVTTQPQYDTVETGKAFALLLDAAPECSASDAYLYDVVDMGRQVFGDLGTQYHRAICAAWKRHDAKTVKVMSRKMLALIRGLDELSATRKELLLGVWIRDARQWGETPEEKDQCERNARVLLGVWSLPKSHEDYSNRQWAGLLGDYYHHRWSMWTAALQKGIANNWTLDEKAVQKEILTWEQNWIGQKNKFSSTPKGDPVAIAKRLWKTFGKDAMNPNLELGEMLTKVTGKDFVGCWSYRANGANYEREILADGTLTLYRNGAADSTWSGYTWKLKGAQIELRSSDGKVFGHHGLRDKATLIFIGESWPAAIRKVGNKRKGAKKGAAAPVSAGSLDAFILTPPPSPKPRINGAKVFGARPGAPFLFKVPATGRKPLVYSANGLPSGLKIDRKSGIISGKVASKGTYKARLEVSNTLGRATRDFRIEIGDQICLTPPMGWNSWYCHSEAISEKAIRDTARAFVEKGLVDHGWSYVNIDDCWQGVRGGKYNAIQPNERFNDMKGMCDYIHSLGLKAGIYSTPWMGTYAGFIGGSAPNKAGDYSKHYMPEDKRLQTHQFFGTYPGTLKKKLNRVGEWFFDRDAKQWADWGFDYVKIDWKPNDVPTAKRVYEDLQKSNRDIVLSLSNAAPFKNVEGLAKYSNCWRTTGDIHDSWGSISGIGFRQGKWQPHTAPGQWNDPDMLQIGMRGKAGRQNKKFKPSRLTPDEQFTQVSLWTILSAPLLLSCDIEALDKFTLSLLTNDEVLEVNQDPAGNPAEQLINTKTLQVWRKRMEDGSFALGIFNTDNKKRKVTVQWKDLKIDGSHRLRDLWRQKDLGSFDKTFEAPINTHGVMLLKFTKK